MIGPHRTWATAGPVDRSVVARVRLWSGQAQASEKTRSTHTHVLLHSRAQRLYYNDDNFSSFWELWLHSHACILKSKRLVREQFDYMHVRFWFTLAIARPEHRVWILTLCRSLSRNPIFSWEIHFKRRYSYTYDHSINACTYILLLWAHLKDWAGLFLKFTKSVTKNTSLLMGTSPPTKIIIRHKYNTHIKSRIWSWIS
jgi:hypothetical protein